MIESGLLSVRSASARSNGDPNGASGDCRAAKRGDARGESTMGRSLLAGIGPIGEEVSASFPSSTLKPGEARAIDVGSPAPQRAGESAQPSMLKGLLVPTPLMRSLVSLGERIAAGEVEACRAIAWGRPGMIRGCSARAAGATPASSGMRMPNT